MAILSQGDLSFAGLRKILLTAAAAAAFAGPSPALAQIFDRPPADVQEPGGYGSSGGAAAGLRIDRLEGQVRSLNGQVEQLQFQVKRLEEQLRKFQMDVDARLQDGAAKPAPAPHPAAGTPPQHHSDATGSEPPADPATEVVELAPPPAAPEALPIAPAGPSVGSDGRRHDAFDPSSRPAAPGAPLPLGSAESASKPVTRMAETRAPTGPLDLTPPNLRESAPVSAPTPAPATPPATISALPNGAAMTPGAPADPVKTEYDSAAEQLKAQRYDAAQQGFSAFVQKNPHSRLIAPAIYHLGESFYYQNRHREAAEQFLKIATDYAKSPVAPDAMIKLGVSLNALGAKEQACAFFSEMPRKYPNAPPSEKMAAEREAKKASC